MQEMQEAGYILIMPGGDWNADTTYHILHLVNHNGASWLCKVEECTGQEPSDSNTEFWQRFGTAVDLSGYVSKTGESNIVGKLRINGNSVIDSVNIKEVALLLTGGTIEGNLTVRGPHFGIVSTLAEAVRSYFGNSKRSLMWIIGADGSGGLFDNTNSKFLMQFSTDGNTNTFNGTLTTKPTGTYTGNGDATTRTIATGGIGKALLVYGGGYGAIVYPDGAIVMNGTTVTSLPVTQCSFADGNYVLATAHEALNANGVEKGYIVL